MSSSLQIVTQRIRIVHRPPGFRAADPFEQGGYDVQPGLRFDAGRGERRERFAGYISNYEGPANRLSAAVPKRMRLLESLE